MWLTDWERQKWHKPRAKKTSFKDLAGIQVKDDGAAKKGDGHTQGTALPNHLTQLLIAC